MRALRPHDHWRAALKDRDHATAVKVTTAMVSVSPAGGVLRAAKAAKKQARLAGRAERSPGDTLRTAVEQRASRLQLVPAGPGRACRRALVDVMGLPPLSRRRRRWRGLLMSGPFAGLEVNRGLCRTRARAKPGEGPAP